MTTAGAGNRPGAGAANRLVLAYLGVSTATLVWGTIQPIGKVILSETSPGQLTLARSGLTALTMLAVVLLTGRLPALRQEMRRRPGTIALLGLCSFSVSSGLSMLGLSFLPASISSLLTNTSPLMLAIGVALAARRLPSPRVLLGLAVGFAGVALLLVRPDAIGGAIDARGVVVSLIGSCFWAAYAAGSRRLLRDADPFVLTAIAASFGSLPLLALVVVRGELVGLFTLPTTTTLLILYAGILAMAMPYALWMSALRHLSATNVMSFQYFVPLMSVAIAVAWLGEPLDSSLLVGGGAILFGVAAAQEGWSVVRIVTSSRRASRRPDGVA